MIGIIDYGVGDLFSLRRSLEYVGAEAVVSGDEAVLRSVGKLILPGVGAFGDAAAKLRATGLDQLVQEEAAAGKPQLLPPDFHHQAVPLAVVPVTQNGVGVGPGIVRFCAVFCFCVGEDLLAGHGVSCSRFNIFSKSKCFPPNSEARVSLIRSSNFSVNDSCCKFRNN